MTPTETQREHQRELEDRLGAALDRHLGHLPEPAKPPGMTDPAQIANALISILLERRAAATKDILAVIARVSGPDRERPTEHDLAEWLEHCPPKVAEEEARRLRLVYKLPAEISLEDARRLGRTSWGLSPEAVGDPPFGWRCARERVHPFGGGPRPGRRSLLFSPGCNSDATGAISRWLRQDQPRSPPPLLPLVKAWQKRPKRPARRHVIATEERRPPRRRKPLLLSRAPGVVAVAAAAILEAYEVDGEAFATAQPGVVRRWQMAPPQGELFPYPKTLGRQATAGMFVDAVAEVALSGDERSPLRGDLLRLGNAAYSLTGRTTFTPAEGAVFIGGRDTPHNRQRWFAATRVARVLTLTLDPLSGRWVELVDVAAKDTEGDMWIGPPGWWLAKKDPRAHRLSGALFRSPAERWGGLDRTVNGIEGALLWGTAAGKGKRGRIPDYFRAVKPGGHGPEILIPWWQVLRLSGENVGPETRTRGKEVVRYKRRVAALRNAGYFCPRPNRTAPAGDTVEILRQVLGGRHHPAGLVARATARGCAVQVAEGRDRVRLPASRLLLPPGN